MCVTNSHTAIPTHGGHKVFVATDRRSIHHFGVPAKLRNVGSCGRIPDACGGVVAGGDHQLAVLAQNCSPNHVTGPSRCKLSAPVRAFQMRTGCWFQARVVSLPVPGLADTTRFPLGGKGRGTDRPGVALIHQQRFPARAVPDPCSMVLTSAELISVLTQTTARKDIICSYRPQEHTETVARRGLSEN